MTDTDIPAEVLAGADQELASLRTFLEAMVDRTAETRGEYAMLETLFGAASFMERELPQKKLNKPWLVAAAAIHLACEYKHPPPPLPPIEETPDVR